MLSGVVLVPILKLTLIQRMVFYLHFADVLHYLEHDACKLIVSLTRAACDNYLISTSLLKEYPDVMLPTITRNVTLLWCISISFEVCSRSTS